jgi:hypothetical protein
MKNTTLLFSLIICFGYYSCKKARYETEVCGKVHDASTLAGIATATVYLQKQNYDCFTCPPQTVTSTTTDANGNYSFTFMAEENFDYTLVAAKEKYYNNASTGGVSVGRIGKKNKNKNIPITPYAWIKLHVKNTTPFDGGDYISVNNSFLGGGGGLFMVWRLIHL